MEEDLDDVVPCTSLAVESILRVGTAGAIWGLCTGPYDARTQGLKGIARAYFVANSVRVFGTQCGLVAGVFSITHCGVKKYRRRNDWAIEFVSGEGQVYFFSDTLELVLEVLIPVKQKALKDQEHLLAQIQVNGLIGGAAAGAAVAARTRSWPQVIGMAGLVSVFCAAADYSRT
ncbi:hypothetical protein KIW84_064505 [Lathyrus oleraceus]|uniref:Uncharacterized protein n=1 Tax=Pisum sativum TaxID=3888 RepID=A0A9D4WE67_PEA|nr:hypothetical protein KIW84_064505 [Pisum sativum]